MSEAKHTPGPWTHNLDDGGFTIFGSDGTHICWRATPFANIDRTRILADVELLTLAPETAAERDALRAEVARLKEQNAVLLEACNGLITILERWAKNKEEQVTESSAIEFANAFCSAKDAVAKAEGSEDTP